MAGHVLNMGNTSSTAFPAPQMDPYEELLGAFSRMDGDRSFSYALWAMPGPKTFQDGGTFTLKSDEYIQCAGTADELTVEIRSRENDEYVQSVIGRDGDGDGGDPVTIRWQGHETTVGPQEVWDAEGAARLFIEYYETGTVGDWCTRCTLFRAPA